METRRPILGLLGALLLLLGLVSFTIAGVGAAPGSGEAPAGPLMQDPTAEPAVDPTSEPPPEPTTGPPAEPTAEPVLLEEVVEPTAEPTTEPPPEPTEELTEPPLPPPAEPTAVPPTDVPSDPPTAVPTQEPGEPTQPPGEPTQEPGEPTVVVPTGEPGEELSSFFISKLFCATIDEAAEEPCVGRVPAAEGSTVYFEVTYLEEGWSDTFGVEIEETDGFTFGWILLYDAPLGSYRVTEIVPGGYEGFAVPLDDSQVAEGASVVFEVGPVEEQQEAFFVNVPLGQEPPATHEPAPTVPDGTTPDATTPGGTGPDDDAPQVPKPDVTGPGETPGAEAPVATAEDAATVAALPDTGAGRANDGAGRLLALQGALAALLMAAAVGIRRHTRG